MLRQYKLHIFSGLLYLLAALFHGYGQSSTVNFIWIDKQNRESNGSLHLEWENNPVFDHWKLLVDVTWYDADGATLGNEDKRPLIYLSEYDIEVKAGYPVKCLNFSVSDNIYELQFNDSGELRFELGQGQEEPGSLEILFRYTLSKDEMALGNIDPISVPGQQKLIINLPDLRKQSEGQETEIVTAGRDTDPQTIQPEGETDCVNARARMENLSGSLILYSRRFNADNDNLEKLAGEAVLLEPSDTLKKSRIADQLQLLLTDANYVLNEIDSVFSEIGSLRELISGDRFPADSVSFFGREAERINSEYRSLRSEYVQNRIQIRNLLDDFGTNFTDIQLLSLKKSIEDKYSAVFKNQLDSAQNVQEHYLVIEPALLQEIRKGPKKALKNSKLADYMAVHDSLKQYLESLYGNHKEDYFAYRESIIETGEIISLENLHVRFDELYTNTGSRINNMDLEISRLEAMMSDQGFRPSLRNIIIFGSALVFLIILLVIALSNARRRISLSRTVASVAGNDFGLIEEEPDKSAEYYKMIIPSADNDLIVIEIHFNNRLIKSIYQLAQGALLNKKPDDFGGVIFGRQYRDNSSGNGRYILLAEKAVPATHFRPGMSPGSDEGAVLVDEIEQLVKSNKKMALLGWFTSSGTEDLQMPDNQVKVHRTFFRDKWQIACLINPASEGMNSAVFVRRKSGFFDPLPGEDYLLKWDQLYQFAVNPPLEKELLKKEKPDPAGFVKINLNQNWCDSIVETVYMHPSVLLEMETEKESGLPVAAGQTANGFFYGEVWPYENEASDKRGYEVFVRKLAVANNSENPREIPGSDLLGWIKYDSAEIFESLRQAIPYHEEVFKAPFQFSVMVNTQNSELRIFSRKHSLEMNNNTIETEELNLNSLVAGARSLATGLKNNSAG